MTYMLRSLIGYRMWAFDWRGKRWLWTSAHCTLSLGSPFLRVNWASCCLPSWKTCLMAFAAHCFRRSIKQATASTERTASSSRSSGSNIAPFGENNSPPSPRLLSATQRTRRNSSASSTERRRDTLAATFNPRSRMSWSLVKARSQPSFYCGERFFGGAGSSKEQIWETDPCVTMHITKLQLLKCC